MISLELKKQIENFWIEAYLPNRDSAYLNRVIKRAYMDFARTLTGVGIKSKEIYPETEKRIIEIFEEVKNINLKTQEQFDRWFLGNFAKIDYCFKNGGYQEFKFGQYQ